jgi:hypothetical protein
VLGVGDGDGSFDWPGFGEALGLADFDGCGFGVFGGAGVATVFATYGPATFTSVP